MSYYNIFSHFYDRLTDDVDYKKRTKYIIRLFERFDRKPTLLLDFACGTGNFSVQFAKMGIDVIGVDRSEGMLSVAQDKNYSLKQPVLYLHQSGEELDLFGTVDGAVCCLDSLNHITDYENFKKCISNVSLFLEPERLFIFDVNTIFKHKKVLANNSFKTRKKGVDCLWTNRLLDDNVTVEINLNFTYKKGLFSKKETVGETFLERAYSHEEIESALTLAGFKIEAVYGENTFLPPSDNSQRNFYVARKVN